MTASEAAKACVARAYEIMYVPLEERATMEREFTEIISRVTPRHTDKPEQSSDSSPVTYRISDDLMDEAFHAECEVVARRFRAELLKIVKIDAENKTVTMDSAPERECVVPGWQATIYNLELPE